MICVDRQFQRQWKRTRNVLKQYWLDNGGLTNPVAAKSKVDPNCRSPEDWEHMCTYWETEKAKATLSILHMHPYFVINIIYY